MSKKEVVKKQFVLKERIRFWIIGILVICVYGKTLKFDFIGLDDQDLIVDNYAYISDLSNLGKAFTTHAFYNPSGQGGSNVYYRPVLTLSFMLDAQIGRKSAKFYHLTNILFHIVSCLLLLKLLMKLKIEPDLAFVLTLLFAVHPVLTQAVAWIPGRNDSLLTVFACAGFISLLQYLETKRRSELFLHFLFFALSIFTKETAIVFPFLCMLYVFVGVNYGPGNIKSSFVRTIPLLIGYFIILIPWFLLRQQAMNNTTADLSFSSLSQSLLENLPLFLQAIQKAIVPIPLSILSVPEDTNYFLSIGLVLLISFLLMRSKSVNKKNVFFGFVWFAAFLLPSFLVKMLTGFEHRVYLPLIGLMLIVSEIDLVKRFSFGKTRSIIIASCVLIFFFIITIYHANAFASNYKFWQAAALNSKHSALARMNYGLALSQNGEADRAMEMYKEGLAIDPKQPVIHNNLGVIYARKKMYAEAETEFKKEFEINPKFSDAYFNLGLVYKLTEKDSLMVQCWKEAVKVDPKNVKAISELEKYRKGK